VYGETKDCTKWNTPEDIDAYLKEFKQHSLRNPIVEQVVTETLRTVRDIWKQEGQIDEIHLELAGDGKADRRDHQKRRHVIDKRAHHTGKEAQHRDGPHDVRHLHHHHLRKTGGHAAFDKEHDRAHGGRDHQQHVIIHSLQRGQRRHLKYAHRAEDHHHRRRAQGDPGAVLLKAQHEDIRQDKHNQGRNHKNPSK